MENVLIIVVLENSERIEELIKNIREIRPDLMVLKKTLNEVDFPTLNFTHTIILDADLPKSEIVEFINNLNADFPSIFKFLWADGTKPFHLKQILSEIHGGQPACLWKQQSEAVIADTICRMVFFSDWIRFKQINVVLSQMRDIPTVPFVYLRVLNLLNDINTDAEDIASCLSEDPSLCAMILKLANSAIIGLREPVSSPFEAVMQLGVERIKAFVLSSRFAFQFDQQKIPWFSIERFWKHSMFTASYARQIAIDKTRDTKLADASFTAGILHDVGVLLIASNKPEEFKEIISTAISNHTSLRFAEKSVLGFTHAELAGCLLCLWGIPLSILEAIAAHHNPQSCFSKEFSPLTAVHIANAFANEKSFDNYCPGDSSVDNDYLTDLGCVSEIEGWKNLCFNSEVI
ncbi:MAG: HDOD domain-containing protein [Verrucomicrobiae bacterium]|nr:HDOD domain-containing protein [Verrucomicrobiae bacterium]